MHVCDVGKVVENGTPRHIDYNEHETEDVFHKVVVDSCNRVYLAARPPDR